MATLEAGSNQIWHRRTRGVQLAIWFGWLLGLAVFITCWQLISAKTMWFFVLDAPQQAMDLASRMVPTKWSYIDRLWRAIWDTLNIATLGTMLAIVIAVPVAFCAARNTTPHAALVRPIALFIIAASRSINSLLWTLMLVTMLGPGVFAGVIAIGFRSVGFVARASRSHCGDWGQRWADLGVWHFAANSTGVCRYFRVSLGYQYSRIHRPRTGRCGGDWLATRSIDFQPRLDTSLADPPCYSRDCHRERMGFGPGAPRDYLRLAFVFYLVIPIMSML